MAKCIICGKEIEEKGGKGRKELYCSQKCRNKGHIKATSKYLNSRYHTDDEFRKKRIASNVESNRRRREARKEQVMQELILQLMQAETADEIRSLLEEKTKIKASCYYA